jgi:putative endonuclease
VYHVYAISSLSAKRIYIGHTANIDERLKYHNSGYVKSTSRDRPWKLVASEQLSTRDEARWVEYSLKKSQGKRTKWLEQNKIKY